MMSPIPDPESPNSGTSCGSNIEGCHCHLSETEALLALSRRGSVCSQDSKESVITLSDVRSLDELSLGEFSCPATYDPICAMSETVADSMCKWAEASQTLLFLDWDDTLFPTSDIVENWDLYARIKDGTDMALSDEQLRLVDKWGSALELYLKMTCSLSNRCVILTNAKRPWVTQCVACLAPHLKPLFDREDGPVVVYAREAAVRPGHRPRSVGNPIWGRLGPSADVQRCELTSAKLAAMRQEAKRFYSQYPNQSWKNIISVGDARYEHDAAQELAFCRRSPQNERLRLKTIVTTKDPMIRDLTYRLRLATLLWPAHVHFDGDMSIDMNAPAEKLQSFADALNMPDLHNLMRPSPISDEDEEAVANELDEVAMAVHARVYQ